MAMTGDARIEQLARALRQWIEQQDRSTLPELFANFPTGACEITSRLLALWLAENNEHGFEHHQHDIGGAKEHVCLIRDGLVVDITADQFGLDPVIVTRKSKWHKYFYPGYSGPIPIMDRLCRDMLDRARPALLKSARMPTDPSNST